MPLIDEILKPIPGDNPGGQNLRFAPIYDKIKEARREDDDLSQGAWQHERKSADHTLVIKLAGEALSTQSKDLQIAAWLTEALLKKNGFGGLLEGLQVNKALIETFWDNLYPEIDDGDMEMRAAPLEFVSRLDVVLKSTPLCREGFNLFQYKDSRSVGYEDDAKTKEQKAAREKLIKDGKLAPEIFDRSFGETPKAFYFSGEKNLDACTALLNELSQIGETKFADAAPSFRRLIDAIAEIRHVVHALLQKKREVEPDPVEEAPPEATAADGASAEASPDANGAAPTSAGTPGASTFTLSIAGFAAKEPEDKREAIANVVAAAQVLRKRDPFSPAPYLMLRGLRWGELRGSSDPIILEAPPTEYRQQIKMLAAAGRWADLLNAAETIMALPCSRAWLDLQRFVVEACVGMGEEYNAIAIAIRSELRVLLRDLPQLLDATLTDDTPAANPQTQAWLRELMAEPGTAAPSPAPPPAPTAAAQGPGWQKKFIDPHALALEAVRSGQAQKGVEILQRELERQLSGRGRFQRKMQLAQICIAAGKDNIAQLLCDDIAAAIDAHKLEEWEDRAVIAAAMYFLLQTSKKIQADAKIKQALFERLCRLDPVQALSI